MIVNESILNQIFRSIEALYIDSKLSSIDADDLSTSVKWIENKSLNESNISYVIESLRSFKSEQNKESVCKVINEFRKVCGSYLK